MAEKENLRRTGDCRIKLAPEMLKRLEVMAEHYGMPMATLAAFAVAEWVGEQEHKISMMRAQDFLRHPATKKLFDEFEEQLSKQLPTEATAKDEAQIVEGIVALSQKNLPLEGNGGKAGQ